MSANPTNIKALPATLDAMVVEYINAKKDEDRAKATRLLLEERILALAPAKEEGSTTTTLDNGFKVTSTGKLTYKGEVDTVRAATAKWEPALVPLKTTVELDETGCKYLRRERPDLWKDLAPAITVAPAKTSIKVGV